MAYTPIYLTEDDLFNNLPEKIGQVSLNYAHYSGKDLYSDGEIENTLLEIVKNHSKAEYQGIIEKRQSWPILYHLSPIRGNIVDFLPITKEHKVLEIGSGCGAITDKLSEKAKSVTCVDLSAKRSMVNAYRNQDRDNIEIHVGNFSDIEPSLPTDFDFVCLIGVFEYGNSYISSENPYEEFLNIILRHKKPDGRVIIAIENKFGLKYWAGCMEDHNGEAYASIEGYPKGGSARTFTRPGLIKIFENCKVKDFHFYYPYPDYKLPNTIYSDKRLPVKGELTDNLRNLDRNRMMTFNENLVFDSIVEDNEFALFSNSYLVVLGEDISTEYVKYSNERKPEYALKTEILRDKGVLKVVKSALYPEGEMHIKKMQDSYEKLQKRYEGSGLKINRVVYDENAKCAIFDYETGVTLESLMDECVRKQDKDGFKKLFDEYYEKISFDSGEVSITDNDLIFANILVDDKNWTVIDYEWTSDKTTENNIQAFRAIYCYVLEDERRNRMPMDGILSELNISPEKAEFYAEDELAFQKEVTGNHKSLGEIRATIGTYAIDVKKLFNKALKDIIDKRIQVYYDRGTGYSEADSEYIPDVYKEEGHIVADIPFDGNVKALRIDPADRSVLVMINEMSINGINVLDNKKAVVTNGKQVKYGTYAFETMDPNINILLNDILIQGENTLHVDIEIANISLELAKNIADSVKKIF